MYSVPVSMRPSRAGHHVEALGVCVRCTRGSPGSCPLTKSKLSYVHSVRCGTNRKSKILKRTDRAAGNLMKIVSHLAIYHRVEVAFSEGPKLLPFYENLAKWQLLPLYAHILSVTFTVLPQTHNREAGATTARRRSRWRGRTAEWTDAPFPKECVSVCRARNAGIQDREVSCS